MFIDDGLYGLWFLWFIKYIRYLILSSSPSFYEVNVEIYIDCHVTA